MKRTSLLFLCWLMFLHLSLPVLATESDTYETAGDLWNKWCQDDDVPDYITGIWSTDGSTENLTIGLVPGEEGEQAKEEILALIVDDSTVSFVTQTYSRNYLLQILEDVNTYFERNLGFMTVGTDEYANQITIELHADYETNPDSLAAVAQLQEKYGDAVSISFTNTIITTVEDAVAPPVLIAPAPSAQPEEKDSIHPAVLIGALVPVAVMLLVLRRKKA